MRFFLFGLVLAAMLFFVDHALALKFQQSSPAPSPGRSQPSSFDDRVAALLLRQIKESLQGHSPKKMLAAFELTKMKDGALFKQQVTSFFDQTGVIRVHFNLQHASTEVTKGEASQGEVSQGIAVLDAEMEAEAIDGNAPLLHKHVQLRLIAESGASGWKITDVQPRSFFSTQP